MIFVIKADAHFEAENIDDALEKLSDHFRKIVDGEDSELFIGGEIQIEKCSGRHEETKPS